MKKRIYISGPITGLKRETVTENFKAAERAIRELLGEDWAIINPSEVYPGVDEEELSHDEWMTIDLALLQMCDAIFMLPGWQRSDGAVRELDLAQDCEMDVYGFAGKYWEKEEQYTCPEIETLKKMAESVGA